MKTQLPAIFWPCVSAHFLFSKLTSQYKRSEIDKCFKQFTERMRVYYDLIHIYMYTYIPGDTGTPEFRHAMYTKSLAKNVRYYFAPYSFGTW